MRAKWLFITTLLSMRSFAGTVRTLVAVGTSRLASMLATTRRGGAAQTLDSLAHIGVEQLGVLGALQVRGAWGHRRRDGLGGQQLVLNVRAMGVWSRRGERWGCGERQEAQAGAERWRRGAGGARATRARRRSGGLQRAREQARRRVRRRRGRATPPRARRLPLRLKCGLASWGTWGTQPAALFLNVVRGKQGFPCHPPA